MKYCMNHWNALKDAIRERGLYGFVSTSGEEAAKRTVSTLAGEDRGPPDPLIEAHNMVLKMATERIGLDLFVGEKCPACELVRVLPPVPVDKVARWPDNEAYVTYGPVDAVRAEFIERGWMADA